MGSKQKAKAKPEPAKLAADKPTFRGARVHTVEVDMATAVKMQACGYRIEERKAQTVVVYGDADALKAWSKSGGRDV